jgi:hypothetical protein
LQKRTLHQGIGRNNERAAGDVGGGIIAMSERIYFEPGKNPPFPGYEAWLEEVKRAPIWQAKAPRQYVPDMRDGIGKELFPPPPPRSNLEPEAGGIIYDAKTALAVIEYVWLTRHDLIWEMLWFDQYSRDETDVDNDEYDKMFFMVCFIT